MSPLSLLTQYSVLSLYLNPEKVCICINYKDGSLLETGISDLRAQQTTKLISTCSGPGLPPIIGDLVTMELGEWDVVPRYFNTINN